MISLHIAFLRLYMYVPARVGVVSVAVFAVVVAFAVVVVFAPVVTAAIGAAAVVGSLHALS